MSLLLRTGSNISWIILSDFVTKITTLLATIYLARQLGVEYFGIFSLSVAVASTLWPVVDLGITEFGIRKVARAPSTTQNILFSLNTSRFISATVITIGTICVLYASGLSEDKFLAISFGLVYLIGFALCPDWLFRGLEDMKNLFYVNAAISAFYILTIALFVHGTDDLATSSALRAISFSFGSLIGLLMLRKHRDIAFKLTGGIREMMSTIKDTKHFMSNRIISNLSQFISYYIVSIMLSDLALGLFSAPHRIYLLMFGGISAIATATYPILSDVYKNQNGVFNDYQSRLVTYSLYVFIPGTFVCAVFSEEIMEILFGSGYIDSSLSLVILLVSAPIIITKSIYAFTLSSSGNEKHIFKAVLYGMGVQLVISVAFVPSYGISAAALSILFGETVTTLFMIYRCNKLMSTKNILNRKNVHLLSLTVLLLLIFINTPVNLYFFMLLLVMAYTFLAFNSGLINTKSLRSVLVR